MSGWTNLAEALRDGKKDDVKKILSQGANINEAISKQDILQDGSTALIFAACYNHKEVVEVLLSHRADVDKANNYDETPLYIATQYNHKKVVKVILLYRADIIKANNDGETPLYRATRYNHKEEVEVLLSH
eukprot:6103117-Ditylum_brightwellii.AAC.1